MANTSTDMPEDPIDPQLLELSAKAMQMLITLEHSFDCYGHWSVEDLASQAADYAEALLTELRDRRLSPVR